MKSNEIGAMEDPDHSRATEGAFWAKEAAEGKKEATDDWQYRVVINQRHTTYCANEEEAWEALSKRMMGDIWFVYDREGNIPPDFVAF